MSDDSARVASGNHSGGKSSTTTLPAPIVVPEPSLPSLQTITPPPSHTRTRWSPGPLVRARCGRTSGSNGCEGVYRWTAGPSVRRRRSPPAAVDDAIGVQGRLGCDEDVRAVITEERRNDLDPRAPSDPTSWLRIPSSSDRPTSELPGPGALGNKVRDQRGHTGAPNILCSSLSVTLPPEIDPSRPPSLPREQGPALTYEHGRRRVPTRPHIALGYTRRTFETVDERSRSPVKSSTGCAMSSSGPSPFLGPAKESPSGSTAKAIYNERGSEGAPPACLDPPGGHLRETELGSRRSEPAIRTPMVRSPAAPALRQTCEPTVSLRDRSCASWNARSGARRI